MTDWRDALLTGLEPLPVDVGGTDAVRAMRGRLAGAQVVAAVWDFSVSGGSFGARDAAAFALACHEAAAGGRPLVSLVRSGGTRLQEGMNALVGIPRAVLALDALAAAGVPHVAVADQPTTGGVWVAVVSTADLRVGVRDATVGFSGPRVIEAMTGTRLLPGANSAQSAGEAGLLDAVVDVVDVEPWLRAALAALAPDRPEPLVVPEAADVPARSGWEQVNCSRAVSRPDGAALLAGMLDGAVRLGAADDSVRAAVGRLAGRRVVGVALAAARAGRVTPPGYALLARSATLAGRLDAGLVVLVDAAGADPLPASERAGVAPAIAAAMRAVLDSPAPTIAVVHGEGGSGGALAGAVTDLVAITENGWFAALGPEGAAAALRRTPQDAADLMRVTPRDLLESGFADAVAPTEPGRLVAFLAGRLDGLRAQPPAARLARRRRRWASPLPGSPGSDGVTDHDMD